MEWVKHPIYNIEASSAGNCRWTKIRKARSDRYGYLRLNVKHGEKIKTLFVHNIVAECFIGPKPCGLTVNHKNGVKTDNRAENLEYISATSNTTHAFRSGLVGTCNPVVVDGSEYYSMRECERVTGIDRKLLRSKYP